MYEKTENINKDLAIIEGNLIVILKLESVITDIKKYARGMQH